jgi:hypothetical protein
MYSKLNINDIIKGHNLSFLDKNGKYLYEDKFAYKYVPFFTAIVIVLIKIPDEGVMNIFGICLSILVGLFLNILVLLTSNISSEKIKISSTQKKLRLELLEQTLYNVSYSVLVSIKALIILFLMSIISLDIEIFNEICFIIFSFDFNHFLQLIFGMLLYKHSINIFLILYMILKRINKLFISEINIEKLKIAELKKKEESE